MCAEQHFERLGRPDRAGEAGYIAFGRERTFVSMLPRGGTRAEALEQAQARLLAAVDGIERGAFPPTPSDTSYCLRCAYAAVCRKDYVGDV